MSNKPPAEVQLVRLVTELELALLRLQAAAKIAAEMQENR